LLFLELRTLFRQAALVDVDNATTTLLALGSIDYVSQANSMRIISPI